MGLSVGDFSAQAVVNTILNRTFPDDPIVGEEDAADLRVESGKALRDRIIELANETLTAELQPGEKEEWGPGPNHGRTTDQLLDAIDRGNYNGGRTGRECLVVDFIFFFFPLVRSAREHHHRACPCVVPARLNSSEAKGDLQHVIYISSLVIPQPCFQSDSRCSGRRNLG